MPEAGLHEYKVDAGPEERVSRGSKGGRAHATGGRTACAIVQRLFVVLYCAREHRTQYRQLYTVGAREASIPRRPANSECLADSLSLTQTHTLTHTHSTSFSRCSTTSRCNNVPEADQQALSLSSRWVTGVNTEHSTLHLQNTRSMRLKRAQNVNGPEVTSRTIWV